MKMPCSNRFPLSSEVGEDDYNIACLLMVFVAVALPKLARSEMSFYKAALEGKTYMYNTFFTIHSVLLDLCMFV